MLSGTVLAGERQVQGLLHDRGGLAVFLFDNGPQSLAGDAQRPEVVRNRRQRIGLLGLDAVGFRPIVLDVAIVMPPQARNLHLQYARPLARARMLGSQPDTV